MCGKDLLLEYNLNGRVGSGKNNTTEANTRTSGAYVRFAHWYWNLNNPDDRIGHFALRTKGDDFIAGIERRDK